MNLLKNSYGKYNIIYKLGKKSCLCSSGGKVIEFDTRIEAEQVKKQLEDAIIKISDSNRRN
ncbi:hypothetical protein Dacet_0531 [Denitrovibrio acetiphilus DSM 12809]|uniref:Uncharacterized protein n=1 Tax=Denitrovibrio acetiphilus (strain DSM 12809 / NBRC 114555 / N2460) TaxID=522772 RepID=D4H418_DENA2|nr:hypothetical protein [Denitrovibrio acetiphilus]ADD67329.1 hypothetical protein Dacet_0531 [Denitrovibrio acetiphilus DSM 12809]